MRPHFKPCIMKERKTFFNKSKSTSEQKIKLSEKLSINQIYALTMKRIIVDQFGVDFYKANLKRQKTPNQRK